MYIINHKNRRNSPFQFQYWIFSLKNRFDDPAGIKKKLDIFIAAEATFPLHSNLYNPRSKRVGIPLMCGYCREKLHVDHFWEFKG